MCMLVGSGIHFCHFWNVMIEELGGVAYMHAFSVCGVFYGFDKLGRLWLCVYLGSLVAYGVCIWKQSV